MSSPAEQIRQKLAEQEFQERSALPHGGVPGYAPTKQPPTLGAPGAAALQARGAGLGGPPPAVTPFTQYVLQDHAPPVRDPTGYEGAGGEAFFLANRFLEGARRGRREAFERAEDERAKNMQVATNAIHGIVTDPNLTPEAKQKAQALYDQYLAGHTMEQIPKGAEKHHPAIGFFKNYLSNLLGPGARPTADPGDLLKQLGAIRVDANASMGNLINQESQKVEAGRQQLIAKYGPYWTVTDLTNIAGPAVNNLLRAGMSMEQIAAGSMAAPKTPQEQIELEAFRTQRQRKLAEEAANVPAPPTAPPPGAESQPQAAASAPMEPVPGPVGVGRQGDTLAQMATAAPAPPAPPAAQPPVSTEKPPTAPRPQAPVSTAPVDSRQVHDSDVSVLRALSKNPKSATLFNRDTGQEVQAEYLVDRFGPNTGWYSGNNLLSNRWTTKEPKPDQSVIITKDIKMPDGKPGKQMVLYDKTTNEERLIGEPRAGKWEPLIGSDPKTGKPRAWRKYEDGRLEEDPSLVKAVQDDYQMFPNEITGRIEIVKKPVSYGGDGNAPAPAAAGAVPPATPPPSSQPPKRPVAAAPKPMPGGFEVSQNPYPEAAPGNPAQAGGKLAPPPAGRGGGGPQIKYPKPNPDEVAAAVTADSTGALWNSLSKSEQAQLIPILHKNSYTNWGKPPSTGEVAKMAEGKSGIRELEILISDIEKNKDAVGPVAGLIAKVNPWSDSKAIQARIAAVRQIVGKGLEGGVLRREDEQKYREMLSSLTDPNAGVAISKARQMKELMERNLQEYEHQLRMGGRNVNTGATAAPPQAAGKPPSGSVEKWAVDSNGNLVRQK